MTTLEFILSHRRPQIAELKRQEPLTELQAQINTGGRRPFSAALGQEGISVIAEFKRRSFSSKKQWPGVELEAQVSAYERGGAVAVSILTEPSYFHGSYEDLRTARDATSLPILCKDFLFDPWQLYKAAASGADAVLLMVGAVEDDRDLRRLFQEAQDLDLDCIVEVHDAEQIDRALDVLDADVIGINNRQTFKQPEPVERINLDITSELMDKVPAGKTVVSESGIRSREVAERLELIGVDALLVGSHFMDASDPEAAILELAGTEHATREHFIERAGESSG